MKRFKLFQDLVERLSGAGGVTWPDLGVWVYVHQ